MGETFLCLFCFVVGIVVVGLGGVTARFSVGVVACVGDVAVFVALSSPAKNIEYNLLLCLSVHDCESGEKSLLLLLSLL